MKTRINFFGFIFFIVVFVSMPVKADTIYRIDTVEDSFFTAPATGSSDSVEETVAPETKVEETVVPDTKVEETVVPDTKVPETKVEDTKVEDTKVVETKVPETKVEDTKVVETKVPETKVVDTKVVDTKVEQRQAVAVTSTTDAVMSSMPVQEATISVPASVSSDYVYKLNNQKKEITLVKYIGKGKKVIVPASVNVQGQKYQVLVDAKLFYGNTSIKEVTFKKGCRTKNGSMNKMFMGCKKLEKASCLPWDATTMVRTFQGCTKLKKVSAIPAGVSRMSYTFMGCKSLHKVTLPAGIRSAKNILNGCKSVKVSGISKARAKKLKGFFTSAKQVRFV